MLKIRRVPIVIAVCLIGACSYEYEYERLGGKSVQKELCPTGCNTDVEQVLATPLEWEQLEDKVFVSTDDNKVFDDPCAMLPAEGVCAYVCDPEELIKHIPPGTCTHFRCELRDGREIVAGGCALP